MQLESFARPLRLTRALAAGFSPALLDLARNLSEYPEDQVTLLAPLLLLLALRRGAAQLTAGRSVDPAAW